MADKYLEEFKQAQAILSGHFVLSSGLHSDTYLQCARVLMDPARAARLCRALADKCIKQFGKEGIDIVASPAMGGVVVGYEMARQLGCESVFCERVEGEFIFRRGFTLEPNLRVLVVEDVITTGKSSLETFEAIARLGAKVVGEACLIDRSNGHASSLVGVPVVSLIDLDIKTYAEDEVPAALQAITITKPGSRFLKK